MIVNFVIPKITVNFVKIKIILIQNLFKENVSVLKNGFWLINNANYVQAKLMDAQYVLHKQFVNFVMIINILIKLLLMELVNA